MPVAKWLVAWSHQSNGLKPIDHQLNDYKTTKFYKSRIFEGHQMVFLHLKIIPWKAADSILGSIHGRFIGFLLSYLLGWWWIWWPLIFFNATLQWRSGCGFFRLHIVQPLFHFLLPQSRHLFLATVACSLYHTLHMDYWKHMCVWQLEFHQGWINLEEA